MAIELFSDRKDCCGCGACMNICPKNAITMEPGQNGFLYPVVNSDLCISCKACKKVCNYQNEHELNEPKKAFAAVNRDEKQLMLSASGGVFSAIATKILKEGGVVFGATLSFDNGYANPHHIGIESIDDLPKLQGSKYVQSKIGDTYRQAKRYLLEGRKVLFSGTPCQIDGLYGYLKKDYDSLITVDVICHGVPNEILFNGYLQEERKKRSVEVITGYAFRDKRKGWGMNARIDYIRKNGKKKSDFIPARLASYNTFFLDGDIYRENCYFCVYAKKNRSSDLTIGDYWGIEVEHPEIIGKDKFDERKGISCILANTEKGVNVCEHTEDILQLHESEFDKISHKNGQLNKPSVKGKARKIIFEIYKDDGYGEVENWFKRKYLKQIVVHAAFNRIPRKIRIKIKSLLKN